jgi:hypothetical protein
MVHGLEAKYYGRIQFSFLDADDPQTLDIQRSLGFQYQPEIYLLDGKGNVLEKWVGYARETDLETAFNEHLQ